MMDGSKISCMGIVGDGCGGGREFIVEDGVLYAYYPPTDEKILLLEGIKDAKSISKKGCMLTLVCSEEEIKFDLSSIA